MFSTLLQNNSNLCDLHGKILLRRFKKSSTKKSKEKCEKYLGFFGFYHKKITDLNTDL